MTLGAVGQGMVAGDLVNTASRLQSVAPPGTVLVGEATYRATHRGDRLRAGRRRSCSRARPRRYRRGARSASSRSVGGAGRSTSSSRRSSAARRSCGWSRSCSTRPRASDALRLVSVIGQPGIGKSRLAWEFHKYIDGIIEDDLLAPGSLARVRRGDHLLGARRDGPQAGRAGRDRRRGDDARAHRRDPRGVRARRGGAALDRAAPPAAAGRRRGPRRRPRRALRRVADVLRARRRSRAPSSSCSRTSSGPTRACSTSSTTCSSGVAVARSSS